jgi:hypothetical protein
MTEADIRAQKELLRDEAEQMGELVLMRDGSHWITKKRGKGYYVEQCSERSDKSPALANAATKSVQESE